jgi:hypothetical protein
MTRTVFPPDPFLGATELFWRPDETVAGRGPIPRYVLDAVEGQLGPAYVPIDVVALNLSLSASEVLDALERRHGIGQFLDVSSRNYTSVRLRGPARHDWLHTMPRRSPPRSAPSPQCIPPNPRKSSPGRRGSV